MNVLDIFSGGGGLTEGFYREGYNIIAHIEKDKWACETLKTRICYNYLKSKGDLKLYEKYIRLSKDYRDVNNNREVILKKYPELREELNKKVLNLTFGDPYEDKNATHINDIIKKIENSMEYSKVKKIEAIIGGPPCQAYSLVGRGVMKDKVNSDKRNYLFRYYKYLVEYFKPNIFVFENVPGIITAQKGNIFKAIESEFKEIGYKLSSGESNKLNENIVEMETLNLPQKRKRVILFGYKEELNLEYPNIKKYKYLYNNINTKDAIYDLPKRNDGIGDYGEVLKYRKIKESKISKYQSLMRENSFGVTLHQTRKHNDRDLQNYKDAITYASKGKKIKYTDIPLERRTHKNDKVFLDRFKVHWWYDTPHTILAHISKDGHYNIHPDIKQCRSLTVREAARIQTFPDNYFFEGPRTSQYIQVGNAVPPLMAQSIARAINELINNNGEDNDE